jgi:hypothetical protein
MFDVAPVIQFAFQVLAYGGGGAAVAYLLFQFLGKTWLENKFAEKLEQVRHQQALELQRLRVEIDSMLSGAIKLQDKEFDVLPEAWAKLDEAHGMVTWLVSPMQQYADVDRMTSVELEEHLSESDFTPSQKDKVRNSSKKGETYRELIFWHRLFRVKKACGTLQSYVARNGIFLPAELKQKFMSISEKYWMALSSRETGQQVQDWTFQSKAWASIKDEAEPIYKSIEADIQQRLQSHGKK